MSKTSSTGANHRRDRRRQARQSVRVTCQKGALGLGPNLALALLDLSENGARLMVKEALAPGQEVELGFLGPCHSRPLRHLASVIWCVPTADNTFCVGARLEKSVSWADLQSLS